MIITVKNLQQQTFTIEFEPAKTVLELKKKIFDERGPEYVVEKQKLIYAGVILVDERTIASYNIDEKKFVVVMLKRDLCAPSHNADDGAASTSSEASMMSTDCNAPETKDKQMEDVIAKPDIAITDDTKSLGKSGSGSDEDTKSVSSGSCGGSSDGGGATLGPVGSNTSILSTTSGTSLMSGNSFGSDSSETSHSTYSSGDLAGVFSNTSLQSRAESNLLMGEEYNRSVESMIEMGYCREMVERAMAASFNNPERAVEYLISGIPETENGFNATSAAASESAVLGNAPSGSQPNIVENPTEAVGPPVDGTIDVIRTGDCAAGGTSNRNEIGGSTTSGTTNAAASGSTSATTSGSTSATTSGTTSASTSRGVSCGGCSGEQRPAERDPFEFLRNQPQFVQMRSLLYQNPDLLQAVLEQIGQTNPALLRLISENQDAFLNMINRPVEGQAGINPNYARRMTPNRRAQLAAIARSAGGDGPHLRTSDLIIEESDERQIIAGGDAGDDTIPPEMLPQRPDFAAERRAAAADAFMRERAVAAAAVAALTATTDRPPTTGGTGDSSGAEDTSTENVDRQAEDLSTTATVEAETEEGITTIRLTQEDQDAIERLKALGFPEELVLQAYFACDKDEQLAANFLISSAFDD